MHFHLKGVKVFRYFCWGNQCYLRVTDICNHFAYGREEDAHEFMRYLLHSMEEAYLAGYIGEKYVKPIPISDFNLHNWMMIKISCVGDNSYLVYVCVLSRSHFGKFSITKNTSFWRFSVIIFKLFAKSWYKLCQLTWKLHLVY